MKTVFYACFLVVGLTMAYPQNKVTTATEDPNQNVIEDLTTLNSTSVRIEVTSTSPVAEEESTTTQKIDTTKKPPRRYPCSCDEGECGCCTGSILQNFNISLRPPRGCVNITYEPDDFAFNLKLLFNDRVLYKNRMSAKNPKPVCVRINRYLGIKMCLKVSNVFISQRNLHACVELEGQWQDESAFNFPFDCFRIGSNGLAVVKPEDGGGLPPPPPVEESEESGEEEEDYDDSARGWVGSVEEIKT